MGDEDKEQNGGMQTDVTMFYFLGFSKNYKRGASKRCF